MPKLELGQRREEPTGSRGNPSLPREEREESSRCFFFELLRSKSCPEGLQDLFGVAGRIDLGIDREDVPVGTDDVAHPFCIGRVPAVAGAVREPDFPGRVAEQREVVVELLREGAILRFRVEADAQNLRVLLLELPDPVAEPATFGRSAGSVGLGVEPEDDDFSQIVFQSNEVTPVILDLEVRRSLAFLQHGILNRSPREAR
jgi:hypothetical protein